MSIVLSIYSEFAYKEYPLPKVDNSDYSIVLNHTFYKIKEDTVLNLQFNDNIWSFLGKNISRIQFGTSNEKGFNNNDIFRLITKNGEKLTILVSDKNRLFKSLKKYTIKNISEITIGKSVKSDIVCDNSGMVSHNHAKIFLENNEYYIENLSPNGTYVEGLRLQLKRKLAFSDTINVAGLCIVFLGDSIAIDTERTIFVSEKLPLYNEEATEYFGKPTGKKEFYHRSPRCFAEYSEELISVPDFQPYNNKNTGSFIGMLSSGKKNKEGINKYLQLINEISAKAKNIYLAEEKLLNKNYPSAEKCLEYSCNDGELWSRNHTHKDLMKHRLGLGDKPSCIKFHLPKTDYKANDEIEKAINSLVNSYSTQKNVPILLDVKKHNLIGIVGDNEKKNAFEIAKILSAQIASNVCYTDVKLCYIYDETDDIQKSAFQFAKWLPHSWDESKQVRYVGANPQERERVFYELSKVFRSCSEKEENNPYYVVFVSDNMLLEGNSFSEYAYSNSKNQRLTTIVLSQNYKELPNNCSYIIENTEDFSGIYNIAENKKFKIDFDAISDEQIEKFSRKISPYVVYENNGERDVPENASFFDMMKIREPEEIDISELWSKNRTYEAIKGYIGVKSGGKPCVLDVHEKACGPHGLIAGTTGSGKSEVLKTFLLSLAVNYSPEDVCFFIIDYKGGGMANVFKEFPHLVGHISNLSGNQVKRAMISVKSENRRRQRVFADNGVSDINTYTKMYKRGEVTLPIPHLFIIVDEFAELKREQPDFMQELISVAQVGRSLGVHLILSTQKPEGTIDDDIKSNSKFRICLRVQSRKDSMDMLSKEDAAFITNTGRGYLQVGNNEIYEMFQSGYSGAGYDKSHTSIKSIANLIDNTGRIKLSGTYSYVLGGKSLDFKWINNLTAAVEKITEDNQISLLQCLKSPKKMQEFISYMYSELESKGIEYIKTQYNTARLIDFIKLYVKAVGVNSTEKITESIISLSAKSGFKLPHPKEEIQFDIMKKYILSCAKDNGYTEKMMMWLPQLSEQIYFSDFEGVDFEQFKGQWSCDDYSLCVPIAFFDDPENQVQMPLILDFYRDKNIGVFGTAACGKSTMLQTIAFSLINKYSPDVVNIYGIDFSIKALSCFENSPHFGGIVYESDTAKAEKLFTMLYKHLDERKKLFKGGNYLQYIKTNGITIPSIVVLVDNYSAFKRVTEEKYEEKLISLMKEGVNYGIYFVISGTGYGMNDIPYHMKDSINTSYCLSLSDRFAYSEYLNNRQINIMPEKGIKGRGLACYGNRVLEFQTALAVEAENDFKRSEKIAEICNEMKAVWQGKSAYTIPQVPLKPVWSEFVRTREFCKLAEKGLSIPVGYNSDNAEIYGIPLDKFYCLSVCGRQKSGKTNFIRILIKSAIEIKGCVSIIDTPEKNLVEFSQIDNIGYGTTEEEILKILENLIPVFKERNAIKKQLLEEDYTEDEIVEKMSKEKPYFIFISDFNWFVPFAYETNLEIGKFLENVMEKGSGLNIHFVSEIDYTKSSILSRYNMYNSFISYKTGIHFGGSINSNHILTFDYLSYSKQSLTEKAGTGALSDFLASDKERKIIVPMARR